MIIKIKEVPRLVFVRSVIKSMEQLRPNANEHAIILLPFIREEAPRIIKNRLQVDVFEIAIEYQSDDLNPIGMAFTASEVFATLGNLSRKTRVPFIHFVYSDEFRRQNRHALLSGTGTYRLISAITGGIR